MKKLLLISVLALILSSTAQAANKQLYHYPDFDVIVSSIAGTSLEVNASDNITEWIGWAGNSNVLGFTNLYALPSTVRYNPYDGLYYYLYHRIWFRPDVMAALLDIRINGFRTSMDSYHAAVALLTLDHEAQHWRLYSADESKVNACALADLPRLLTSTFNVQPTIQETDWVTQSYRVKVKKRVKYRGHWVYRYRWVTRYRQVSVVNTVPNPIYTSIVVNAQAFYQSQPPPYNAGVCA